MVAKYYMLASFDHSNYGAKAVQALESGILPISVLNSQNDFCT